MPIFTLDNSRVPPPPRQLAPIATQESRTVAAVGITVVAIIVALTAGAFLFIKNYVVKFAIPDDSQASLSVAQAQTVYTNPKYGITVRLPGEWSWGNSDFKYFCTLSKDGGLSTKSRPVFPMLYTTADQYADAVDQAFQKKGWALLSDSQAEINGRSGHIMRFEKDSLHREADIVVVKKWPAMYELLVTGPRDYEDWSGIRQALPRSIELK